MIGPKTRVVERRGCLLLPGLQDGHAHFINSGRELGQLDLKNARTPDEFGRLIVEYARAKPACRGAA